MLIFFSILCYYHILNIFPVLYNRSLLVIYFIYSCVYVLVSLLFLFLNVLYFISVLLENYTDNRKNNLNSQGENKYL